MTYRNLLLMAALLVSPFAGCSKWPNHGTWPSGSPITIEPGVSIGPVHSGMTIRQVTEALGKPEQTNDGVLEYLNLGLSVLPAKGGLVGGVLCMSSGKSEQGMKTFAGNTKEGIHIGSSRAEILTAYGAPTSTEALPSGTEVLRYKPLGIDFKIKDGKVGLIAVFFKP